MKKNMPVTDVEIPFPSGRNLVSKTDLKGVITYANDEFIRISGFTESELLGKSHNIVRHPEMPPQAFADLWSTIQQGKPWRGMVKNRTKQGDFYWVDATVVPLLKDGQIEGYMSVRSEPHREQIRQAEALYQELNRTGQPVQKKRLTLTLRTQLIAVFLLTIGFFTALAGMTLLDLKESNRYLEAVHQEQLAPLQAIERSLSLMDGAYKHLTLGLRHNPALSPRRNFDHAISRHLDKITDKVAELQKLKASIEQHARDEVAKTLLDDVARETDRYMDEALLPGRHNLETGNFDTVENEIEGKTRDIYESAKAAEQKLRSHIENEIAQKREIAERTYHRSVLETWILFAIGSAILLLGAYRQIRAINVRLKATTQHFKKISEGILTEDIDISRQDEFGLLNQDLVVMQTNIKIMLDNVRETIAELLQNSADLHAQMSMMMQSGSQRQQVQEALATIVDFSHEVADSAGQAAEASSQSQSLVESCNTKLAEAMTTNGKVAATVNDSSRIIMELGQSIQKVGDVTQAIRSIADQTNLLALNAAIEAARAGDAGRGFAVVADEVRKLSVNTSNSTSDISKIVEEIQRIAKTAVSTMNLTVAEVNDGVSRMGESVSALELITAASIRVDDMSAQIAGSANQLSNSGEGVAEVIRAVAGKAEQNLEIATQASAQAHRFVGTAEIIRSTFAGFRLYRGAPANTRSTSPNERAESSVDLF
jgi:aerotaxis receptor